MDLPPRKIDYSKTHGTELVDHPIHDIDQEVDFMNAFIKARDFTMTNKEAMYALYTACCYVSNRNIPGDFVECGTWKGGSAILAGLTWQHLKDDRRLWLYDTFQGMTAPTDVDVDVHGNNASGYMAEFADENGWCYASKSDVEANVASAGLDQWPINYVEGDVLQTLPNNHPEQISILRLDTDWYESTRLEMELLYPRLAPGGILIIDDYGCWEGSRKAVDDYFSEHPAPLLHRVTNEVRMAIKI